MPQPLVKLGHLCAAKMSRRLCPVGLFPRSIIEKKLLFCGKTVVTLHRRIYGNFFCGLNISADNTFPLEENFQMYRKLNVISGAY